jgi:hypothetical protein
MRSRVEYIFHREFKNDKSFMDKPSLLGAIFPRKYSDTDMRETFHRGARIGIEIGLNEASPQGQRIQLDNNTDLKHREFLEKMYALCEEYECSIEYHPEVGMIVLDKMNSYER